MHQKWKRGTAHMGNIRQEGAAAPAERGPGWAQGATNGDPGDEHATERREP